MSRMEVIIPTPSRLDFDFNEARPLSFLSAPSTPKRFGDYFVSAPTSPSRVAEFYRHLEEEQGEVEEEEEEEEEESRVGSPKSPKEGRECNTKEDAFAFRFSFKVGKVSVSTADAEELFHGGKIRTLKPTPPPPPGLLLNTKFENDPLRSSLSSSPRSTRKKGMDPTMKGKGKGMGMEANERGRGRSSNTSRRGGTTRSLSPYRVSGYTWEEAEDEQLGVGKQQTNKQPSLDSKTSSKSSSRKWRLTDLLLFRSASEGRASDKYRFWKYSGGGLFRSNKQQQQHDQEVKSSSFRSVESSGSVSKSSRRKPSMSAHELHYTLNKAASQELKKRTFLPYKPGIFGGF